jgi:integrase
MKTSVKLRLRESTRTQGSGVLVIHVTHNRKTRSVTISNRLAVQEWDEEKQKVITDMGVSPGRSKELSSLQRKINKDLRIMAETVKSLEDYGSFTASDVIAAFRKKHEGGLFCEFTFKIADKLHDLGRFGTSHAYAAAAKSFFRFLSGKDIRLNKIDASLMKEYEVYLTANKCKRNTVSCYMRSLRASFITAVRGKVVDTKRENPFGCVFTGNESTEKRAVNEKSIRKLCAVRNRIENSPANASLILSCDLFLFSFFTQGMPFADIARLKKENIKSGHIWYCRQKTGQKICIRLEKCMKRIIKKYSGNDSEFVFPILSGIPSGNLKESREFKEACWKKVQSSLATYNSRLKQLAKLTGIEENLTSYVPRHSWATIASHQGIPVSIISRGMGHESEKTTRIYIAQLDYSDVGDANHRVLERIFGENSCCL